MRKINLMISMLAAPAYADVFLETTPNATMDMIAYILMGVGILVLFSSMFITFSDDSFPVMMGGFVMTMLGVILLVANMIQPSANEAKVMSNMVENVKEKYDADLQIDRSTLRDIDEYQTYTLTFENGAKGEYKIKFESTGEPILEDTVAPPTAEELNSETETSNASPKVAPTSAELEEESKK